MTKFSRLTSVTDLGKEVIAEHHPELMPVRIEFVMRDTTINANGKEVWGRAKKITGLAAYLADEDGGGDEFFLIELSMPVWNTLSMDTRRALIDHELCHCGIVAGNEEDPDAELKLVLHKHDFEEFGAIIERHGLWRKDAEDMAEKFDAVLEA